MADIPVFLFTGFLGAGKTRFIQSTLEDPSFTKGNRTLLIMCEDGEEEYDPSRFGDKNVFLERIEEPEDLVEEKLRKMLSSHRCNQVMVEFNGMWMLDDLYRALPKNWAVAQELFFAETPTILTYNANMRNLVVDKLKSCELAVFNRFPDGADKMPYHKLVRGVSRRADIAYEDKDGNAAFDDIEDPLPFDVNAPIVEIGDDAYALWYRDMTEEPEKYSGKTVRVLGRALIRDTLPKDEFLFGRQVMTCCVDDIQFAGLICRGGAKPKNGDWILVTAVISNEAHPVYSRPGPVLTVTDIAPGEAPEQPVATFY